MRYAQIKKDVVHSIRMQEITQLYFWKTHRSVQWPQTSGGHLYEVTPEHTNANPKNASLSPLVRFVSQELERQLHGASGCTIKTHRQNNRDGRPGVCFHAQICLSFWPEICWAAEAHKSSQNLFLAVNPARMARSQTRCSCSSLIILGLKKWAHHVQRHSLQGLTHCCVPHHATTHAKANSQLSLRHCEEQAGSALLAGHECWNWAGDQKL